VVESGFGLAHSFSYKGRGIAGKRFPETNNPRLI